MRDTVFPRWQGAFLAIFLLAGSFYVPATPEAIWSLVWGTLLAAAVVFLFLRWLLHCDARDFESLCRAHLPRPVQVVLFAAVGLCALAAIAQSLLRLSGFWQATAFPGLPRWVTAAVLLGVGWCAGRRGRTAVAMWAYPTVFLISLTLAVSLLVTLPDCSPAYLVQAARRITLPGAPAWQFLPLLLPLLLCTQTRRLPSTRACTRGVLLGGAGLTLLTLRAWLLLGAGAQALPYPVFSAAGLFSVGDFLQRGEVVFGCVLALCESVRVALLVTLAREMGRAIFAKKDRSPAPKDGKPVQES